MPPITIRKFNQPDDPFLDFVTPRSLRLTITPEMAREILDSKNTHNRGTTEALIKRLVEELTSGQWVVNGETIIFSKDGMLLDGQHRLEACVRSGIALTSWIVFGQDAESFDTIDKGKVRRTPDDLAIAGEECTSGLAAVLGLLYYDDLGMIRSAKGVTSRQAFATLEKYPQARNFVSYSMSRYKKCGLPPRALAFTFLRLSEKDKEAAEKFFADLESGANLSAGDPVLCLKNRLFSDRRSRSVSNLLESIALVYKAWNYRRRGRTINNIRWRQDGENAEEFPKII